MFTSEHLIVHNTYTREDLKGKFNVTDATINTGIFKPVGHNSVWIFVTETKQKDRTQYKDKLEGDVLKWESQPTARKDHLIIEHGARGLELLLFYRKQKYEFPHAAFRFEGRFMYLNHIGPKPHNFVLTRVESTTILTDLEIAAGLDVEGLEAEWNPEFEGGLKQRLTNYYERAPRLRAQAIAYHGTICKGCGFDFETMYGPRGKGFIEVHHLKPISTLAEPDLVDPKSDMTVLCANCHRIVHKRRNEVLSLAELIALVAGKNLTIQ